MTKCWIYLGQIKKNVSGAPADLRCRDTAMLMCAFMSVLFFDFLVFNLTRGRSNQRLRANKGVRRRQKDHDNRTNREEERVIQTFDPLSLKIISTSKIFPNCCRKGERERDKEREELIRSVLLCSWEGWAWILGQNNSIITHKWRLHNTQITVYTTDILK